MVRDRTYIDENVECVVPVVNRPAKASPVFDSGTPEPAASDSPHRVFNIGNSRPSPLEEYIKALEDVLGRRTQQNWPPM